MKKGFYLYVGISIFVFLMAVVFEPFANYFAGQLKETYNAVSQILYFFCCAALAGVLLPLRLMLAVKTADQRVQCASVCAALLLLMYAMVSIIRAHYITGFATVMALSESLTEVILLRHVNR